MNACNNPLLVHSMEKSRSPVLVKEIEHEATYDFTHVHRHNYYEIFFFKNGGGNQLVDFIELPVLNQSCYIVFPRQVHLLRRNRETSGQLIQFSDDVILSGEASSVLQQAYFARNTAVIFENSPEKFQRVWATLALIKQTSEKQSYYSTEISLHYLQVLVFQLMEHQAEKHKNLQSKDKKMANQFQQLLEEQYLYNRLVQNYSSQLNITEKRLSAITKKYWGLNPLQVIHTRLLLEAKRKLLNNDICHKEIAYHLNFDSPASFSQFIKNKTGSTPSSLQKQLAEIHK